METFDNVIFTDESTIQLEHHRRMSFQKKKTPRKLKYKHKHPPKVHVWGGISKQGATHLVIFTGIMNTTKYGDILSGSLCRLSANNEARSTAGCTSTVWHLCRILFVLNTYLTDLVCQVMYVQTRSRLPGRYESLYIRIQL